MLSKLTVRMDPTTGIAGVFTTQCFNFGTLDPQEVVFNKLERALYDGLQ